MSDQVLDDVDDAELEKMFDEFAEGNPSADEPSDSSDSSDDTDWKAKAEALEQESKQWEHKFNSDAGRVAAMQRKIADLEASERVEIQTQEKQEDSGSTESLDAFMDDYPDIYSGMTAYLDKELEQRTASIRQELQASVKPMEDIIDNQRQSDELNMLSSQHADWQQVSGSQEFHQWVAQQPHQIVELAQSDFASDASYALSMFKAANGMGMNQSHGESVAEKRKRQLLDSTSIPSRANASTMPLAEDDEEALFNFYAEKIKKR